MSNLTDFFPSAGGGGGGILKQHIFTASGTFDLTTLGIADGDTIGIFLVGGAGGGDSGSNYHAGYGGNMWQGSTTIGTAGTVTVVIGAGGTAGGNVRGGSTSITGGGITGTISTGTSQLSGSGSVVTEGSPGYVIGGAPGYDSGNESSPSQYGINGYGSGGLASGWIIYGPGGSPNNIANIGAGGGASAGAEQDGGSGVIIIYYS